MVVGKGEFVVVSIGVIIGIKGRNVELFVDDKMCLVELEIGEGWVVYCSLIYL